MINEKNITDQRADVNSIYLRIECRVYIVYKVYDTINPSGYYFWRKDDEGKTALRNYKSFKYPNHLAYIKL